MFVTSGAFFVFFAVALWSAIDAARQRRWRKGAMALVVCLPLAALGIGCFWFGSAKPDFNVRNNQGFPGNWSCINLGKGSAQACGPDDPAAAKATK